MKASNHRMLDLFSGIGGFSLAFEALGIETVAFCESDPEARKVLRKHWGETIPIHPDIKEIDGTQYRETASIVCGGIPCQPWSQAGTNQGHLDSRDLWKEMYSVIRRVKPTWAIIENVRGFVNKPMGMPRTISDLESEGFQTRNFLLPACGIKAPHQRYRIFVVAYSDSNGKEWDKQQDRQGWRSHSYREDVAYSKCKRQSGQGKHKQSCNPKENCEGETAWIEYGSKGRHNLWNFEPNVGRVVDGIPRRIHRLKQLGNSVVPPLIYKIGKAILDAEFFYSNTTQRRTIAYEEETAKGA